MGTFTAFLNNAALMLILCVIYDIFNIYAIPKKSLRDGLTGVLVGLICIAVMLNPWSLEKGLYFDTRLVLLSLCGLYFGFIPTMLAVVLTGAFRLYQGGPGGIVGTVVIVVTACVGLAWKYWKDTRDKPLNCVHLYLFGIVVQLAMLSCIFFFPADLRNTILKNTALPILLIYPVLTTIIGLILKKQEDRRIADKERLYSISLASAALESTPDGILIVNMEGKITRWNQKFVDLWNVPQHLLDTTVKNPLLAYATAQMVDPKKFLSEAKELHDNPDKTSADTLTLADGRILNFYSQPQKIGSEIVGRFWAFRDITDRKRSEAILRSSETKFRSIVETSQDWIWEMDLSGKHTFSNARVSDILGYSLEDFLLMDIKELVHQEDSQEIINRLPQHILERSGWRGWVLRWRHTDGSYKFLESNANPIFSESGELVGFRGVDRDITERKKAEEALQESEERFRSYIVNSPHAIFVSNKNGRYLEVNPAASSITGYSAEELLKMGVMDLLPPDSFEWGANSFKQLVENGYSSGEAAYRRKSGEIGFWSLAAVKVSPDRFIGFVTDVTERKQFEDALASSERFLKTIIDTEPECIKMLDSDCKVLMMNPAGLEMIQAESLEQVKGQCVCPLITSAYRDAFASLTKQVFQGHSGVLEFETIGLKGRHIWLETHAVPFRNDHDEIVSLLGITRDITERKETNEKIRNLNEHLEKMVEERTQELAHANRDLNSLCYTISHELMAPVTRLKSFGQILQEQLRGNPGKALHCAERITVASDKLQNVIDAVLQLARLSQVPFDPVPQNLSNIARVIVDELVKGIPARHVEVSIADGIMAICDPQMVRTCLSNLFENALKFSVRQPTAKIEFGYDTAHGALFVRDNGVGFDMSQADRLFEPFIRMHLETEFAGSGIGLATVRRIVERHGGRIWAEAEQGKGATFYFTLTGE